MSLNLPQTFLTIDDLLDAVTQVKERRETLAFVPTMGALHLGHLALVQEAKKLADHVIVSIFVNPTQFGPNEDFAKYPRTFAEDLALLSPLKVCGVFAPSAATMYPEGFQTYVVNRDMATTLDGVARPGHFDGVLTVVQKLLNLVKPDIAVFGKKDYQQWRLIETMVRDLYLPVKIVGLETIRERDGLALSSRNRYLSDEERLKAPLIIQGLNAAKEKYQSGVRDPKLLSDECQSFLAQDFTIDYVEVRSAKTLKSFQDLINEPPVMLVAARLGQTRLIDNLELEDSRGK